MKNLTVMLIAAAALAGCTGKKNAKAVDKITRNFNAKRRGNVHACKASL